MLLASIAGVFFNAYVQESITWAAQGTGQDYVNIFIVFPTLLLCVYFIRKGSIVATLIWLGVLIYIVYSYILYSFFVHFGPYFLIYIATLSFSFYAFLGGIISLIKQNATIRIRRTKALSIYLFINGMLFAFLWFSEIFSSLQNGIIPPTAAEIGAIVNPVHVLDLAFILPAMITVAALLWKKNILGNIFAIPIVTFAILMGMAILSMIAVMKMYQLEISLIPIILMSSNVGIGVILLVVLQLIHNDQS
jgi:hypothetical protein